MKRWNWSSSLDEVDGKIIEMSTESEEYGSNETSTISRLRWVVYRDECGRLLMRAVLEAIIKNVACPQISDPKKLGARITRTVKKIQRKHKS